MLDIVPGTPSAAKPKRPQRDDASVVKIDWKLPARLRKPIRHELAKQRQLARQQADIVQFKRHPVITKAVASKAVPNSGAEYHTGDVYRHSQPGRRVAVPPYAGRFARSFVPRTPVRSTKAVPVPKPAAPRPVIQKALPRVSAPAPVQRVSVPPPLSMKEPVLQPENPTFSLPMSFSIWPISSLPTLFSKKKIPANQADVRQTPRKKV